MSMNAGYHCEWGQHYIMFTDFWLNQYEFWLGSLHFRPEIWLLIQDSDILVFEKLMSWAIVHVEPNK